LNLDNVWKDGEGQGFAGIGIPFCMLNIGREVSLHVSSNDNALYFAAFLLSYNEDKQRSLVHCVHIRKP
jgi:hypothetical protein